MMENLSNGLDCSFDEVYRGVYANDASLRVSGQKFNQVNYGIIHRSNGFTFSPATLVQNSITGFSNTGISLSGIYKFQIAENTLKSAFDAESGATGISITELFPFEQDKTICSNNVIMEIGNSGIKITNGRSVEIIHNQVKMGTNGRHAIYAEGGNSLIIEENRVDNFSNVNKTKGVFINGCFASTLGCTKNSKNQTGINFFGACDQSDFKGSNMSSGTRGLVVGLFPNIGGTFIGDQIHRGNQWTGSYEDFGAYFAGINLEVEQSQLFVDPDIPGTQLTTIPNVTNWIIEEDDENLTFFCPNPLPNGQGCDLPGIVQEGPFPQELDELIAGGILVPGFTNPTTTWIFNRHLTQRIGQRQTALSPTITSAYLSANATASFKTLNQIGSLLQEPTTNNQYLEHEIIITTKQTEIESELIAFSEAYTSLLQGTLSEQQFADFTEATKSEIASLKTIKTNSELANESIIQQNFNTATALNNAVSSTLLPALNEKSINSILLAGVQTSDLNILENIAVQCPLDGGDAVYIARGLLELLDHPYDGKDEDNCASYQDRQLADQNTVTNSVILYPNPANESLNISGFSNKENTELRIYNWTGNLVETLPLSKGAIRQTIQIKDWPAGIYYYSTNAKDAKTHKLVVTH